MAQLNDVPSKDAPGLNALIKGRCSVLHSGGLRMNSDACIDENNRFAQAQAMKGTHTCILLNKIETHLQYRVAKEASFRDASAVRNSFQGSV
jgi:hypothetical protein